jgi:hypothetical protein
MIQKIYNISSFILIILLLLLLKCSYYSNKQIEIKEIIKYDTLKIVDTIQIKTIDTIYLTKYETLKAYKCDSLIFTSNIDFSKLSKLQLKRDFFFNYESYLAFKQNENLLSIAPVIVYNLENKALMPAFQFSYKNFNFMFSKNFLAVSYSFRLL